jgi:hypothetical protein
MFFRALAWFIGWRVTTRRCQTGTGLGMGDSSSTTQRGRFKTGGYANPNPPRGFMGFRGCPKSRAKRGYTAIYCASVIASLLQVAVLNCNDPLFGQPRAKYETRILRMVRIWRIRFYSSYSLYSGYS